MFSNQAKAACFFVIFALSGGGPMASAALISRPEKILKENFPRAESIRKENILLTREDLEKLRNLAKAPVKGKLYTVYRVKGSDSPNEKVLGVLLTRKIRTKNATALYIVRADGSLHSISLVAFHEPSEYKPSTKWLQSFSGKGLSPSLNTGKQIPVLTGATLTAKGFTEASRIALALWKLKFSKGKSP